MIISIQHKAIALIVLMSVTLSAKAQFNLLVHNENDTIIIPTNKVDSVSFDMTPEMQAQMKLYKTVKVLTCEKDVDTAKRDSIIVDSLQKEISSIKEKLEQVLKNYDNLQSKVAAYAEQGGGNVSITIPTASTQYTSTIVGLQSDWAKDCSKNNVFGTQNLGSHCREKAWIVAQGQKTQTSTGNCAFGYHSMFQTYNGKYNVGIGIETLDNLTQGEQNTAIGTNALQMWGNSNKEATSNQSTAVGANSQRYTYNRRGNVSLGFESLSGKSSSGTINCCRDYNIAIGFKAGKYATSDLEVYIGSCTNSKPYVDNAEEKSCTLIYGKSDTSKNIDNQFVKINGKFACNGVTPQAPLTANADATDLATALILLNQIKDALIKSGLMK